MNPVANRLRPTMPLPMSPVHGRIKVPNILGRTDITDTTPEPLINVPMPLPEYVELPSPIEEQDKLVTPTLEPEDPNQAIIDKGKQFEEQQRQQAEDAKPRQIDGYHGTRANIDTFRPSKIGAMGPGIYFSKDKELASRYAQNNLKWDGMDLPPKLYKADVDVKNPFVISSVNASPDELFKIFNPDGNMTDDQVIQKVREAGYDGIMAEKEGEFVAFEPSQIKSHSFQELTEQDMEVAKRNSRKAAQEISNSQDISSGISARLKKEPLSSQGVRPEDMIVRRLKGGVSKSEGESKPITAYHKTNADFEEFDPSKVGENDYGYAGQGVYLTPKPLGGLTYGKNTLKTEANLKNPYVRTSENWKSDPLSPYTWIANKSESDGIPLKDASKMWTDMMKEKGYDGFIDKTSPNGEIVVFDTKQVKILSKNKENK